MLASVSYATGAGAACQLRQMAELEVHMAGNAPLIPASINDHLVQMLVDTGAMKSLIWRYSAKDLGLVVAESNMKFYGAGGAEVAGVVLIKSLTLAGATVHNLRLFTAGHVKDTGFAGIVGEDLLSNWDLEFDLSAQKLRLFSPKECKGGEVVYWAPEYSMMKLISDPQDTGLLKATVQLNGRPVVALLDTGASSSVVSTQAMSRSGIKPETPMAASAASRGLAGKAINTQVAIFPSLGIGQETVQNAKLRIADLFGANAELLTGSFIPQQAADNPDMIIGADFFLSHRIYIARSQRKVYFTYNGGPIFQTSAPKAAATSDTPSADAGSDDSKNP